jgi:glycosyltransferase involved in cell wall biosynthesis
MRILYISTVFPRPEQSSTIYTDLAEALKKRGHEIFVVATDATGNANKAKMSEERGIPVLRVKILKMYDVGLVQKGISVVTLKYYIINAMKKRFKKEKFDLILFETPPITIIDVVKWAMDHFNCPSYLMLKDIFPQNGVDIGIIKKDSVIYKYFKYKEKKLYNTASTIGCMSEANKQYILSHNPLINSDKVELFPNTKEITYNPQGTTTYEMRHKYGIPKNKVVAVFGGNMGKPQGLEFLMDIIKENNNIENIFFLLVGRGTERIMVRDFILKEGLTNVVLLEALPRDDYECLMTECDIGLIFLNKKFTIPNFPSRVLSYFEYGLPVIAATDENTDFGSMVENAAAGYHIKAGDKETFNLKLKELASDVKKRHKMGQSGRRYLEENFQVGVSVDILEKHFKAE